MAGGRIAMIVNSRAGEGSIMARRARAFAQNLSQQFEVDVLIGPARSPLVRAIRAADMVYVIDPGRIGFPAWLLARVLRKPAFAEVGDPQAALYRAQGRGPASLASGAAIDWMVGHSSTGVVVRGRQLAGILKVTVPWVEVPDGVDLGRFRPDLSTGLRERLGIPSSTPVVGVVGAISLSARFDMAYGWDVIDALKQPEARTYRGMIVGDGSGVEWLRTRARAAGVEDRVIFTGRVPADQVPAYISAIDVCVSTQSNDAVGRGRTTAKLPEYLACDRFVLATDVGGASDVLPREMLMPYQGTKDGGHPSRLAVRLGELAARQAELREGAGTRVLAERHYSYQVLSRRLAAFLTRRLDGHDGAA
jgi:glycosyltransferase involved in cell wall biosynthesis